MWRWAGIWLACVVLCPVALGAERSSGASATTKAAKPTTRVAAESEGCMRGSCHVGLKDHQVLHGPTAANACEACHTLTDAAAHRFVLARQGAELCTYCHEFDVERMPTVHKPVKLGECLGCHDPHGGRTHALTREATTAELCGRCHDPRESVAGHRKHLHTPVKQGECDSCHAPHASRFPKMLDAVGSDLCLRCHEGFDRQLAAARFRHKALEDTKGCERCHDAHGSSQPMALTQPVAELCSGCHEKVRQQAASAAVPHKVVLEGRSCMNCHTAHGGNLEKLTADLPAKVCVECHKAPVRTDRGTTVAAVAEVLDVGLMKHGPVAEGQCGAGCHNPHGGDHPMLLTKAFAPKRNPRFSVEAYALCFSCHDAKLAQEARTETATKFRNGRKNLHALHLKGSRGENCRMCHAAHATPRDRNTRETVQYGVWKMPVNLTTTPTGGRCAPGCHGPEKYDRDKGLAGGDEPAGVAATTRPAAAPARAGDEEAMVITWAGKDVAGADVGVPAAGGEDGTGAATLVVCLNAAGREADGQLLSWAEAARQAHAGTRVVVIVSGSGAPGRAAALAESKAVGGAVVADESGAVAARWRVSAWPAVMVVQPDGRVLASVGGTSSAVPMRLAAYLDFAARRVDRAALDRRLTDPATVGDEPAKRAARYLRQAEALLADGDVAQAKVVLREALRVEPESTAAGGLMVRVLSRLDQDAEAVALLAQLPKGTVTDGAEAVVRAKALIGQQRWADAKRVLSEALEKEPGLADAQFLMGRVYENEKDWPKAAAAYRAAREGRR